MAPKQSLHSPPKAKNYVNMHAKMFRNESEGSSSTMLLEGNGSFLFSDDDEGPASQRQQQQQLENRHVRFAVSVKKHSIINRDDYTAKELDACFYSHKEELKSAKKRGKIVKRMEEGKKERKDKMSYRGLEASTETGKKAFDEEVDKCISAVMDEQDHQWYITRVDDHGRIAAASEEVTFDSKERARAIAIKDEQEVMPSFDCVQEESEDDCDTVYTDVTDFTVNTKKRLKSKRKQKEMKQSRQLDPPGARVSLLKANSIPHLAKLRKSGRAKKRNSTEEAPKKA